MIENAHTSLCLIPIAKGFVRYKIIYSLSFTYFLRIPFFFEPNFDAHIKPLPAALRIQDGAPKKKGQADKEYKPVVYGQFLLGKVTSNFDTGKGKYD